MRYSLAAFAATLMAKDTVLAASLHGHKAFHERDVTVIDNVIEVATVYKTVTVDADTPAATPQAVDTTTSSAQPTTTYTSSIFVTSTIKKAAAAAHPTAAAVAAAAAAPAAVYQAPAAAVPVAAAAVVKGSFDAATTFVTATKAASTKAAAAGSAGAGTASSLGNKRGICYNNAAMAAPFGKSVGWAHNWASVSDSLSTSIEFVPMLWGTRSEFTSVWNARAKAAIASGSTALMAFNEADLAEQSNIAYGDAAAAYKEHMQPFAGKATLVSPSVTNGPAPMGLTYLKNFISACSTCTIDACAIHWYDSAANVAYFKNYMADAHAACGNKPIWLTEFGATGSDAEVATFLATVIPWMDRQSYIHRYAYFMASTGPGRLLSSTTALSTIGSAYVAA